MSLPERFDLGYIDHNNQKQRPVMIHRVVYGSIERFFGILVEHFAGRFPLWLSPVQAVLLPINDTLVPFVGQIRDQFESAGIRTEIDNRSESLNKKVREAQLNRIPLIVTLGDRERETGTLSVRTLDGKVHPALAIEAFLDRIQALIKSRSRDLDFFD